MPLASKPSPSTWKTTPSSNRSRRSAWITRRATRSRCVARSYKYQGRAGASPLPQVAPAKVATAPVHTTGRAKRAGASATARGPRLGNCSRRCSSVLAPGRTLPPFQHPCSRRSHRGEALPDVHGLAILRRMPSPVPGPRPGRPARWPGCRRRSARCGFPNCRAYAEHWAAGDTDINCPPGGDVTLHALAKFSVSHPNRNCAHILARRAAQRAGLQDRLRLPPATAPALLGPAPGRTLPPPSVESYPASMQSSSHRRNRSTLPAAHRQFSARVR